MRASLVGPRAQLDRALAVAARSPRPQPQKWSGVAPPACAWHARRQVCTSPRPRVAFAASSSNQQPDETLNNPPSEPSEGGNQGPGSPLQALLSLLKTAVFVLLAPLLLLGTALSADPPELPAGGSTHAVGRKRILGKAIWAGFYWFSWPAFKAGFQLLSLLSAPPRAEAAASLLLGGGRVGELMAAWSNLPVPSSPSMLLLSILVLYAYYRLTYWFEWWLDATFPGASLPLRLREAEADPEFERYMQRVYGPHTRALLWMVWICFVPWAKLVRWLHRIVYTVE